MLLIRLAAGAIHPRVKMVINIANVASQKGYHYTTMETAS